MTSLFLDVYKNKKIIVTGHTGFKGSWLTLWLKELGAEILGYSLEPSTKPNLFEVLGLKNHIHHVIGDVRDYDKLLAVFKEFQPKIVFHLAAQPLVRLSYKEPRHTYETNVMGTVNILEAVRKTDSVNVVINVTSDKCYENKEWVWGYRETDPMGGYDPYSSSKGCAELVTLAYLRSFFNPKDYGKTHNVAVSSVRAGNVIGGGDWREDRLISDCVKSLSKGESIVIRNPQAIRPWQFVLEPLSGYLWLGALMYHHGAEFAGAWNFGPNDDDILTVQELVELVIRHWGGGSYIIDSSKQPHEAKLLKLDTSKARYFLKWRPVYNIYEAVKETINWYKIYYNDNKQNQKLYEFTRQQLLRYIKKARKRNLAWTR